MAEVSQTVSFANTQRSAPASLAASSPAGHDCVGEASTDVLMVRSLGSMVVQPRLSGDDLLYWRSDIF
jgi:hypothetical protein